jgi:peptidoglycan/LPS O-acetylase OafA/YrhL
MDSTPAQKPDSARRIPVLDGLRALSILLVIMGHSQVTVGPDHPVVSRVLAALGRSQLGVYVFFVISGYIITLLLKRELGTQGRISLKGFYQRRIRRIWPAFFAYVGVVLGLDALSLVNIPWQSYAGAATFTFNYLVAAYKSETPHVHFLGHFWTLSIEEQFYLFWPPLLMLGVLRARTAAIAILLGFPVLRMATYLFLPAWRGDAGYLFQVPVDLIMVGACAALWQGESAWERRLGWLYSWPAYVAAFAFLAWGHPIMLERFRGTYEFTIAPAMQGFAIALIMLGLILGVPWGVVAIVALVIGAVACRYSRRAEVRALAAREHASS